VKKNKSPTTATLETMALGALVPHPDQDTYFPLYDEQKFAELVQSIKAAGGVKIPIDVLPEGNKAGLAGSTIIGGHSRVKASLAAGLTTIRAHVRYDLLNASRAEIDELFLNDNALRRQLSRMAQARIAIALYGVRKAKAGRTSHGSVFRDDALREEIGKILGMSGRNAGRYFNVLESPVEVQDAFEAGTVKLVTAAKVFGLPRASQQELAARLRAGEDAAKVFAEFFPPKAKGHVKTSDAVASFVRSLKAAQADLGGRIDAVKSFSVNKHRAVLTEGQTLIGHLLGKLDGGE